MDFRVPFWVGHDRMLEYGNLMGDIFWTIEPAVCLWLPKILQNARRKRGQPRVLPAPKAVAK